jgi:ribonuclease VapC
MVMYAKTWPPGTQDLDELLTSAAVRCVAGDPLQADLARAAFITYGKGNSQARLNYGGCLLYTLATALGIAEQFSVIRWLMSQGMTFARLDSQ